MEVRIRIRYRVPQQAERPRLSKASVGGNFRAAARLALIAVMFLGTTIGGLEIGHGIWTYCTIARAAKMGARYAEAHSLDSSAGIARVRLTHEIEQIVRANAGDLPGKKLNVVTTWPAEGGDSAVRVRVTYPIRFFTGSLVFANEREAEIVPAYEMAATN